MDTRPPLYGVAPPISTYFQLLKIQRTPLVHKIHCRAELNVKIVHRKPTVVLRMRSKRFYRDQQCFAPITVFHGVLAPRSPVPPPMRDLTFYFRRTQGKFSARFRHFS